MLHQYCGGGGGGHQSVTGHGAMAAASTFSLFFPLPTGGQPVEEACYSYDDHSSSTVTASASPSSSSSSAGTVDCTLSLGTPSSRRAEPGPQHVRVAAPPQSYPSVSAAALSCDAAAESYYCQQGKPAAAGAACRGAAGHDQFLDRRCANCGTSTTPLWRNGPRGPKSLCNACGIRFKKEERRAAETGDGAGCGYSAQRQQQKQRAPRVGVAVSYGEAAEALHHHADADAPFLAAWRLNVVQPAPAFSAPWPERASCVFQHN